MKIKILVLLAVVFASCSSPKYAYYFDHQNYNAGKKHTGMQEVSPLQADPNMMVASNSEQPVVLAETTPSTEARPSVEVKKTYIQMNKAERKALRHHVKKEVKKYVAEKKKSIQATNAMDHDLKLAIIFGAVGIVGLLIGGDVFTIIGGIALLIGVVFFVKWVIRQ